MTRPTVHKIRHGLYETTVDGRTVELENITGHEDTDERGWVFRVDGGDPSEPWPTRRAALDSAVATLAAEKTDGGADLVPADFPPPPANGEPIDGDPLRRLAGGWLLSQRSADTRSAYARDLTNWCRWAAERGVYALYAGRSDLDAYADALSAGLKPATVARKLYALAGFYTYVVDAGLRTDNPAAKVRKPRVDRDHSETEGLDAAEARALIDEGVREGPRSEVIARLMVETGFRSGDVRSALIDDLGSERGHRTLTVTRKGGKRYRAVLSPATFRAIVALIGNRDAGYIVVTRTGLPVHRDRIWDVVTRLARKAGIQKRITPHSLRHTFITLALDAGAPIHEVQDAAGHADPRTTQRYNRRRGRVDNSPVHRVAALVEGATGEGDEMNAGGQA